MLFSPFFNLRSTKYPLQSCATLAIMIELPLKSKWLFRLPPYKEVLDVSRLLSQIPAFFGLVLRFGIICLVMGLLCFLIGEMMPRKNFDYRVFPYACHGWERNGDIY